MSISRNLVNTIENMRWYSSVWGGGSTNMGYCIHLFYMDALNQNLGPCACAANTRPTETSVSFLRYYCLIFNIIAMGKKSQMLPL